MTEEFVLVSYGFPLEDAICICNDMRRDGTLREFIKNLEERHREACRRAVDEVMG